MLLLHVRVLSRSFIDILLQIFLLLESSLAPRPGHLPLHQLDLILRIVEQLLLFLEFLVQFTNVGLQVPAGGHDALNLYVEVGLVLPQFEQLLGVLDQDLLLGGDVLLDLLLLQLLVLEVLLCIYFGSIEFLGQF